MRVTPAALPTAARVVASLANCSLEIIAPSKTLLWCPCEGAFHCARLDVPLDYQRPSLGRASVPLIKYPAQVDSSDGPYQGMILINPGGPGASGVDEARYNGSTLQAAVGTNWDIVGFDTRGGWLSEPLVNCSAPTVQRRSVPRVTNDFYQSFIDYGKALGANCQQTSGGEKDAGPHMTTAVTARDMLSIVTAFAQTDDGKRAPKSHLLNYYGISYGTFLGQTFASMFPNRVGRVVLDGVVSPQGYLSNFTSASVTHLDGILALFFVYCYEAHEMCLYNGSSPKDIYERFNRSFVQLDPRKAEANHWSNATDLEAALLTLKVGLLAVAVSPLSYFSQLPSILLGLEAALAAQNIQPWTKQLASIAGDPGPAAYTNAQWSLGVQCSDQGNKFNGKTLQDLRPLITALEEQSIIGEIWIKAELGCTGWSIKSNDIYTGPFCGDTQTPILFVSNTYDPVTPIENGISSAPNYRSAQVLAVDGMGHTSVATNNLCAFEKVRAYFQETQLPGSGAFCPLEAGPFGLTLNGTLKENIQQADLTDLLRV